MRFRSATTGRVGARLDLDEDVADPAAPREGSRLTQPLGVPRPRPPNDTERLASTDRPEPGEGSESAELLVGRRAPHVSWRRHRRRSFARSGPASGTTMLPRMAAILAGWVESAAAGRVLGRQEDLITLLDRRATGRVQTVNLEHLHLAATGGRFRDAFSAADWWSADGWPLVWLAEQADTERVTGKALCIDLTVPGRVAPLKYAVLGADELTCTGFLERAAQAGHVRVWCNHGGASFLFPDEVVRELQSKEADLLLIALGAAKGEVIAAELMNRGCPGLVVGVGGGIGMSAGTAPCAPRLMERAGLEWAFRLIKEPQRLWRRYLVHYPQVVAVILAVLLRRAVGVPVAA